MRHIVILFLLLLSGCATKLTPAQTYYKPYQHIPEWIHKVMVSCESSPKIVSLDKKPDNIKEFHYLMYSKGYTLIGESNFILTGNIGLDQSDLLKQADNVGGCLAIVYSIDGGYVPGVQPIINYIPPASYDTRYRIWNGSKYYTANATTTESGYGTFSTSYVHTVNRKMEYSVSYWKRIKPSIFGALADAMTTELRKQYDTNDYVLVVSVYNGGPADKANILPGDIIKTVDGIFPSSLPKDGSYFNERQGKVVSIVIIRDGKEISKAVELGSI